MAEEGKRWEVVSLFLHGGVVHCVGDEAVLSLSSSCFFAWFWPARLPVTLPICSSSCGAGAQLAAAGPRQWGFRLWLVLSELCTFVTCGTAAPSHSRPRPRAQLYKLTYGALILFF